MKKTLSMVLALVMTVSLFTFAPASAGAAFTDSNSITYKEAVDVIYALGIMGGYSDGSFRPNGLLTRGAAAKIICCMRLTPAVANTMSQNASSKFTDVPAGHTFAGYIAWCVQQGIVSGYSDNTFHPGDPLTCQAFLKMLLGALGYDQTIEHYTGSGWANNVTNQALMIGLNNGLNSTLNGAGQVNRQDACLFAFNALKSDLVEYTGNRNNRSSQTTTATRGTNIVKEESSPYTLQFAEQYFSDLKLNANTEDAFGCPAAKWTLKNTDVGTYLASVEKVYYNEDVTAGKVYSDLSLTVDTDLKFYVNGEDIAAAGAKISRNDTKKLSELLDATKAETMGIKAAGSSFSFGNGTEIRVFRSTADNKPVVVLSAVIYYPGKIESVQSATSSKNRSVKISAVTGDTRAPAKVAANNEYETEDFSAGDVVVYTFSGMDNKIQDVIPLDEVRGALTRVNEGSSLTIDGTEYVNAMNVVYGSAAGKESSLTVGNTYDAYVFTLDDVEMVMWVEGVQASSDSYAWVKAVNNGVQNFDYAQANLVFANGVEEVVRLNEYTVDDTALAGRIVTYSEDNNGRYKLTPVATSALTNFSVRNRVITADNATLSADNSTVFVVQNSAEKSYSTYTGARNMPNVAGQNAYVYSAADGTAVIIFVSDATVTTSKTDLVFIAANSASNPVRDKSTYRTFNAIVGGEYTKVKVLVGDTDTVLGKAGDMQLTVKNDSNKPAPSESVILDNVEYNSDGLIIAGSYNNPSVSIGCKQGFKTPANGSIRLGTFNGATGTSMDLSNSVNVYTVSTTGQISKINISNVKEDGNDWVYYTQDNQDITNLFILRVD